MPCLPVMLISLPVIAQVDPIAVKFQSVDRCGKYEFVTTFSARPINWKSSCSDGGMGSLEELRPSLPWVTVDIVDIVARLVFSGRSQLLFPFISVLLWILGCVKRLARIRLHDFLGRHTEN